jgi:hypothetical protein
MLPETQPEDLSPAEFGQLLVLNRAVFQKYQAHWFLWDAGHLPDEIWQHRRAWAKSLVSLPVPGRVWEREIEQHQFTDGFVESINSMDAASDVSFRA